MTPLSRLRRYTWWSVAAGGMAVGFGTALDLVTHDYGLVKSLSVALAVALVIVQHTRYMRQAMSGLGRGEHRPWEHAATFAVALAAWAVMAGSGAFLPAWALLPALVVAHVGAVLPARSRWPVVAVMSALTIATGGVFGGTHARPAMVLAVAMIVALVFADLIQLWIWQLVLRQEQGRKTAEALAVAEERLRFAADLHDIQGHHLQAIALKGELAQRLIGRDDDLARQHAGEVAELARTALRETREVVQGYRRASLGTEIANAVGVLRAAGIETTIEGDAVGVPPPLQPLFGALVREGTTNVLRHSRARRCDVVISVDDGQVCVRLANDGVSPNVMGTDLTGDGGGAGAGLAGLRERFSTVGGRIEAGPAGVDGFELVGRAGVGR
ncbi:two-component system sensor histidine kinase DesK [Saccharothrix ecbatanensis]|uniref:Two-component system sensor histidine kinase DesK n=1 Tax=Saccharothrix ecbatanensis TaxID=1105145 RepID=A0A7W9HEH7_9PSEU|nr:histidine kinase [Saccharothrix ecbatanensis]MBB5800700.1 two-component system sensor histidine kinase DesK [Saccharothrix ecbatanensis]